MNCKCGPRQGKESRKQVRDVESSLPTVKAGLRGQDLHFRSGEVNYGSSGLGEKDIGPAGIWNRCVPHQPFIACTDS